MAVVIECEDTRLTAFIKGEIDHHISVGLRQEIDRAIERNKPKMLILDFSAVTFMDSSGIGLVMGRYKKMNLIGGKVKVVNTPTHIKKVMKIAGLGALTSIE